MKDRQRECSKSSHGERGIALAFMAVVFIGIIGMVGLAFDTYLAATSRSQYQGAADAAALAAVERFTLEFSNATGDVIGSLQRATDQAKVVLQQNVDVMVSGPFLEDLSQDQLQFDVSGTAGGPAGANGVIIPGFWVQTDTAERLGDKECPPGEAPCFIPFQNGVDDAPDSFKVEINIRNDSRISTTFMGLFGVNDYGLRAEAISTMVRRQGIFLIDMSPSIHETSHNLTPVGGFTSPAEIDPSLGSGGAATPTPTPDPTFCDEYDVEATPDPAVRQQTLFAFPLFQSSPFDVPCAEGDPVTLDMIFNRELVSHKSDPYCIFKHLPANAATPVDGWSYKSDYTCYRVTSSTDTDYDGNPVNKFFALDRRRSPEPLTSILAGVHEALLQFEQRAVHGDKIGVFGFDNRMDGFLDIRSTTGINLGAATTDLEPAIISPEDPQFSQLKADTDVIGNPGGYLMKFMFPQFFANNPAPSAAEREPVNTDVNGALLQTVEILSAQSNFETSDNFVVLFSDGKSNCLPDGLGGLRCHGQDGRVHRTAIGNTINTVLDQFTINNIALHVVLVGDEVQPHTLLKTNAGSNACLSDREARLILNSNSRRKDRFTFTNPGSGYGNDVGLIEGKYPYPNNLYKAAIAASGLWAPLRNPCVEGVNLLSQAPGSTGQEGALHRSCQSKSGSAQTLNIGDLDGSIQSVFQGPTSSTDDDLLDDDGRLLCDPEGRSKQQQIRDFINLLMQQNPIRLVGNAADGI